MTTPPTHADLTALLGPGTKFSGKLSFEGTLRIDGEFRGEIQTDGILILGETADVQAEINAASVIVRGGRHLGNIRANKSIELYAPAVVTGDLHAPDVLIDRGVRFSGRCTIEGEAPPPAPPQAVI